MHRTGKPQLYLEHVAASIHPSRSTRSVPIRSSTTSTETHHRLCPLRLVHATNTVLQAQCAMRFAGRCLFLAHPRQMLTQSFKDRSTRLVAGAAELFYAKALVALPFPQASLPSFALLVGFVATSTPSLSRPGVDTPYDTGSSWTPTTLFDRLLYFDTPSLRGHHALLASINNPKQKINFHRLDHQNVLDLPSQGCILRPCALYHKPDSGLGNIAHQRLTGPDTQSDSRHLSFH